MDHSSDLWKSNENRPSIPHFDSNPGVLIAAESHVAGEAELQITIEDRTEAGAPTMTEGHLVEGAGARCRFFLGEIVTHHHLLLLEGAGR